MTGCGRLHAGMLSHWAHGQSSMVMQGPTSPCQSRACSCRDSQCALQSPSHPPQAQTSGHPPHAGSQAHAPPAGNTHTHATTWITPRHVSCRPLLSRISKPGLCSQSPHPGQSRQGCMCVPVRLRSMSSLCSQCADCCNGISAATHGAVLGGVLDHHWQVQGASTGDHNLGSAC